MGAAQRSCQYNYSRLLPRRAKPPAAFHEDGTPAPRAKSILAHTPMGRFGQPEELAGAAVFLASAKASGFVTGADLRVDGGYLAQTI